MINLTEILSYYAITRGAGHSRAVRAYKGPVIMVVANKVQGQAVKRDMPNAKVVSLDDSIQVLAGENLPLLIDHHALSIMVTAFAEKIRDELLNVATEEARRLVGEQSR